MRGAKTFCHAHSSGESFLPPIFLPRCEPAIRANFNEKTVRFQHVERKTSRKGAAGVSGGTGLAPRVIMVADGARKFATPNFSQCDGRIRPYTLYTYKDFTLYLHNYERYKIVHI